MLVAQLYPTLCDPMDCSLLVSSVHGILQARMLEWVAISFSRGSSQPRGRTQVSCIAGRFFTRWATREAPSFLPWVFFIISFWFIYYISEHISSYTFFSHCSTYYSVQCLCDLTQFTCVDGLPRQVKIEILPPFFVVVVRLLSCVRLFEIQWTAARQASLSFTISWTLLKIMPIESVMPSNHLVLSCPLLLPSIFPSIRVFSNESAVCTRWPEYWGFNIGLSSEYLGLISFRIDWFDLLAVQGTKSLLQHHSVKASVLWRSAFFMVQLSHLYVTTRKTIAWLYEPLSAKWCLCFLIRFLKFVIAFLPRSKCLLISWLQSPSSVILKPKKIKSLTVCIFSPSIYCEVIGLDAMIFVFWMLSFKPAFSLASFTLIKRLFSFSSLCSIRVVSSVWKWSRSVVSNSLWPYRL